MVSQDDTVTDAHLEVSTGKLWGNEEISCNLRSWGDVSIWRLSR